MPSGKLIRLILLSTLFLLAGLAYHAWYKSNLTTAAMAKKISANLRQQLIEMENEAERLSKVKFDDPIWAKTKHTFFLFDTTGVRAWSRNNYLPNSGLLSGHFEVKLIQSQRGDFLIRKWGRGERSFLVGVIPLAERYKVSNQYLSPQWNAALFPINGIRILDVNDNTGTAICLAGATCYFKIALDSSAENYPTDWISLVLIAVGIIFLLISLYQFLLPWHQRQYCDVVFLLLFFLLYLIRMAMIFSGFPARWGRLEFFDPQRFAASSFNISLGDFVLNSSVVFVCCVYLFLNYSKFKSLQRATGVPLVYQWLFGVLSLTVALFSFLFPFLFFEIVFHNSSISLDITRQVHFDGLRLLAFSAVILGSVSSFLFCHVFVKVAIRLSSENTLRFMLMLLVATMLFLAYCFIEKHDYSISLVVGLVYFSCIYFSRWHRSLSKVGFATFLYLLLAIIAYSTQGALSVKAFTQEATVASQFRFANNNLINQDILGEYLLAESVKRIAQDPFIQVRLANPFLSKEAVRQRVKQIYFSSYFDRYEIGIYLFNASGDPLNNQSTAGLASSIKSYQDATVKTDYEGVYWVSDPSSESIKRYVGIVPINRNGSLAGFVVFDLSLKRIVPQNVYPELLIDNRFSQFISGKDFSFAIFSKGKVSSSFGTYNYDKNFDRNFLGNPSLYHQGIMDKGFQHVAVEGDSNQRAVVTANLYPFFFVLANFAFLFVIGLGLIVVWMAGYSIANLWQGYKLNYAARIQLYVYLAFILPLLVVAVATLSLTGNANESQMIRDFRLKAQQIGEGITAALDNAASDSVPSTINLETEVLELSKSSNTDINIFHPDGRLMASSQPAIFESQLTAEWMGRQAWQQIVNDWETYLVDKESIGLLQYNSSYLALKSPATGKLLGILNLPFFKSADVIEKSQVVVLANILVIFVVVFILFSLLSFYAVDWLTFPLRFIAKTLGKTTLTGANQPLQWKSSDEIGLMVSEYNRMLTNLEQSKVELSRSQKESAWREMAQQVAHEIKNPLTPMKLTLQQMQLSQRGDEKNLNAIKMLLDQVDILNDIASSFSTFAKMPTPQLAKLNIVNVLKSVVGLYANHFNGKVVLNVAADPIFVSGDDQLMGRIFSNIILNGLQSGGDEGKVLVEVKLIIENDRCVIRFKDNGKGIEPAARDRVFTPYFSTKKSGSGLGLAIAKQGIEQCGGKMGFESEVGKGTVFWVELGMVK
jgi:two-component system, NtrC family, nitrogen regulation sensor histidine kinase NtrY